MAQFQLDPEVKKGSGLQAARNWSQDLPVVAVVSIRGQSLSSLVNKFIYKQIEHTSASQ
jgi:hypothetical protein